MAKVPLHDYVPLEEGMAQWLYSLWERAVRPLMPAIEKAVVAQDADTAYRLLSSIDVQSISLDARKGIENGVLAQLTFGAMLAAQSSKVLYIEEKLPPVTGAVFQTYVRMLEDIQTRAIRGVEVILNAPQEASKADTGPEDCGHYHSPPPTPLLLLKSRKLTAAAKLNAVVMGQAKSAIEAGANLSTSRLVGLGFLSQQLKMGIDVYQITAQLDGRVCPSCRVMHGKVFSTGVAHQQLLSILSTSDPDALKQMAPFPGTSKAAIANLRKMTPAALQRSGMATPPFHPGCRCRQVKVGTVPKQQILPVGSVDDAVLADVPLPVKTRVDALASTQLSDTMKGAAQFYESKLSDTEIATLDKIFSNEMLTDYARICMGKPLVQKGETEFSFCSAFNPTKMAKLVKDGDKAIKKWELDSDAKLWRYATGDFAYELIEAIKDKTINGSIIHDKGFVIASDKLVDDTQKMFSVKVAIYAPKGAKAVKLGGQFAFPTSTKMQVFKVDYGNDGIPRVHVKVLPDDLDPVLPVFDYGDPELNKEFSPSIVPAGTAAKVDLKAKLGDDYLDIHDLKQIGDKPGGSVPGYLAETPDGQKWVVKMVGNEEIARNEVLAAKLYQVLGIEVPDLRLIGGFDDPNTVWVASKFVDGFFSTPSLLKSADRLPGLYDNFVADAWLSNWDVVGAAFDNIGMITGTGRVFRIDVGGALRFRAQGGVKSEAQFPNTVVDIDNMRNPNISPQVSQVFKDITDAELRAGAAKVAALSDDAIWEVIKRYGPTRDLERMALYKKLLARRDDIAKRFPERGTVVMENKLAPIDDKAVGLTTKSEWEEVLAARINGKAVKVDFDDIENQNVLLHIEKLPDGTEQTVATFKVRGEALHKLDEMTSTPKRAPELIRRSHAAVREQTGNLFLALEDNLRGAASSGARVSFYEAAKVFDATSGLKSRLKMLRAKLDAEVMAKKLSSNDRARILADFYRWEALADKAEAALKSIKDFSVEQPDLSFMPVAGEWPPRNFMSWDDDLVPMWPEPKAGPIQFTHTQREWSKKKLDNGHAVIDDTADQWGRGYQVAISTAKVGDAEVEFVSTQRTSYKAMHGLVTIKVRDSSPAASVRIRQAIDELGVKSHRASLEEQEFLYLMEMAYLKQGPNGAWQKAIALGTPVDDPGGVSLLDNIRSHLPHLRKIVKDELGLTDEVIDKHRYGQAQAFDQGHLVNIRADLQGEEWDVFAAEHRLVHNNTGGMTMETLVDRILHGGGRMVTNVEKDRRGIPTGGLSVSSDLGGGGADYFYTRITSLEDIERNHMSGDTFIFKADALRRTTTMSFDFDAYGKVPVDRRMTTLDEYRNAVGYSSNETLVKHGLSIFDDLDVIIVSNIGEKMRLLEVFRSHKLNQWPDGRKLEDVVITRSDSHPALAKVKAEKAAKMAQLEKDVPTPEWVKTDSWSGHKQKFYTMLSEGKTVDEIYKHFDQNWMIDQSYKDKIAGVIVEVDAPGGKYPVWLKDTPEAKDKYDGAKSWWSPNVSGFSGDFDTDFKKGYPQYVESVQPFGLDLPKDGGWGYQVKQLTDAIVAANSDKVQKLANSWTEAASMSESFDAKNNWNQLAVAAWKELAKLKGTTTVAVTEKVYPAWLKPDSKLAKKFYDKLTGPAEANDIWNAKNTGLTEAQAKQWLTDHKNGKYVVGPKDLITPTPPPFDYGYEKYVAEWKLKGMSDAQVAKKLATYQKLDYIAPSWLYPGKLAKAAYKQLKAQGMDDISIQNLLSQQHMAPPVKPEYM